MKRVVIVGGGYAGYNLARRLDRYADLVLIDQRRAFVHNVAAIRAVVTPELTERLTLPYESLLARGRVLQARVIAADSGGVTLQDGRRVDADYVVLAMGSGYAAPFKPQDESIETFAAAVDAAHQRLRAANDVAIVGAGAVGVELAGEIASAFPEKKVILLSNLATLIPSYRGELHSALKRRLEDLGVRLRLNATARLPADASAPIAGPLHLADGETVAADIIFPVMGARPHASFASALPGVVVNAAGRLETDPWLRPSTYPNLFVIGDIAASGDGMTVVGAMRQATWLGSTLRRSLVSGRVEDLPRYRPWKIAPILLPLGQRIGASVLPVGAKGMVVGDWFTSRMKGRGLFIPKYRREFGLK